MLYKPGERGEYSTNRHPLKLLPDGSINPLWKPRNNGSNHGHNHTYSPASRNFLAIDGEGITIDSVHSYVLLMCSDGTILRNPNGINTIDALDWLVELGIRHTPTTRKTRNVFVGFSISYDVNMILKDLSWKMLKELHEDGHIWWRGYRIEWRPTKHFSVKRWHPSKRGEMQGILIYDCFGFYQTSFVKAIADWIGTESDAYKLVAGQKLRRHEFTLSELDSIQTYCATELDYLIALMEKLEEATSYCDLRLARYDGAGAIAGALMRKHGIKRHLTNYFQDPHVANAVRSAYFGGRIEQVQYGTARQSWDYDINSAYVRGLCEVPALAGGVWKRRTINEKLPTDFSLVHCRWQFADEYPFYPFPFRQPNGFAQFPRSGAGWYWGVEVNEPYRRFPEAIEIVEWYEFLPLTNEKPYAFLWELYDQRAEWKADGNQAQKALKLGMNSLYGKHAQHVGWKLDTDTGQRSPPTTHQLEYAGFTTAFTRSQLWLLAMSNPDSIIAFQTDGVYSSTRLEPSLSTELGDWTETACGVSVFVQSGVYFTHAETDSELCYSRGFDQRDRGDGTAYLTLSKVQAGWRVRDAAVSVGCTRFVTLSSGVSADSLKRHWRTWRTVERKLALTPHGTKRQSLEYGNPLTELVKTCALDNVSPRESEPYPLPWEPFIYELDGIPDRIIERELKESEE